MIRIDRSSQEQIYHQLYRQLRAEIETGIRQPNQAVASTRFMAKSLAVSRNTVDHAYQDLVAEGYLVSRPGSGYHVARQLPILISQQSELRPIQAPRFSLDFTEDYDHLQLFPKQAWLEAEQAVMRAGVTHIQPAHGDVQYRQQLSQLLARLKGIQAEPEQIIVTSGFNEAAGIIANLLPDSLRPLAVAEPIAPNARDVWQRLDLTTVNFRSLTDLPEAQAYILAPTHNFPDGKGLSDEQRQSLAKEIRTRDSYLIELDTDGALIYDGHPAPAIQHYLQGQDSFYYTNFDDTLGSALCMGILVIPPETVDKFQQRYGSLPNRNSEWQQHILSYLIANDSFERFSRQLTIVFKNRRELLIQTMNEYFGDWMWSIGSQAGTFVPFQLKSSHSVNELIEQAANVGVGIVNPDRCWHDLKPTYQSVILSFRQTTDEQITAAGAALAKVWEP